MSKLIREHRIFIVLMMIVALLLFYKPTQVYPFWFDEGWTLSLARNWVEYGHYGERNAGEFVPSTMLYTGFPATSLYALAFRLFGVGALQARMVGNCIVLVCLVLLYWLINQLFDRSTATLAISLLLGTSVTSEMSPLLTGRQALGEMPMLMYVLVGFITLNMKPKNRALWVLVPSLCFSLAIHTKPQVLPFLTFGLLVGVLFALITKPRDTFHRYILMLFFTAFLVVIIWWLWSVCSQKFNKVNALSLDPSAIYRGIQTRVNYVITLDWRVRRALLVRIVKHGYGLLGIISLLGLTSQKLRRYAQARDALHNLLSRYDTAVIVLWTLCVSWYVWWVGLSIGWARYILPGFFFGSMFTARYLINLYHSMTRFLASPNKRSFNLANVLSWLKYIGVGLVMFWTVHRSLLMTAYWLSMPNDALLAVVDYINTHANDGDLVETYESELFFLLEVDYHYPPDDVQYIGNQRLHLGKDVVVDYSVSELAPDYIVIGVADSWWHIYDNAVTNRIYELVYERAPYSVFHIVNR